MRRCKMKTYLLSRVVFSDGVSAQPVVLVKVYPSGDSVRPLPFFLVRSGEDVRAFSVYREAAAEYRREGFFLRSLGFKEVGS
jgi:hypothetical protein